MSKEELIESIKVKTNNFTTGFLTSTLMSWEQEYDDQGRPLLYNPNYKDGVVRINKVDYYFTRVGWYVYIWKDMRSYSTLWTPRYNDHLLCKLDLTPDYVKEYRKSNPNKLADE